MESREGELQKLFQTNFQIGIGRGWTNSKKIGG